MIAWPGDANGPITVYGPAAECICVRGRARVAGWIVSEASGHHWESSARQRAGRLAMLHKLPGAEHGLRMWPAADAAEFIGAAEMVA